MEEKYLIKSPEITNEEFLKSISNERIIYLNNIKNALYKIKYDTILNLITDIIKNISSSNISQWIEKTKDYIYIYEDEPLNKIKSDILEYNKNKKAKNENNKNKSYKPNINENLYIYKILLETNDLIGCHIYYFVSTIFEYCDILSYKYKYLLIKEDLLKCIKDLEEEYKKMKKENQIEDNIEKEKKEIKRKILEEYKNRYESMIINKRRKFEFLKKTIHSGSLIDFFEFCDMHLLEFGKYEKKFLEMKNIFPLIYFFKSYIKDKKYEFLIYKTNTENANSKRVVSLFKNYNTFKIKNDGKNNNKKFLELIEDIEKEIQNLFAKFENDVYKKCDINNFMKTTFTYKSSFCFIPQIEIKFNDIKDITKDLIDNLKLKLNQIFKGKDIKIIEMKKGSLDIAFALNYLIQESLNDINLNNISSDKFLKILNEALNIKAGNIKTMLQDNLVIA